MGVFISRPGIPSSVWSAGWRWSTLSGRIRFPLVVVCTGVLVLCLNFSPPLLLQRSDLSVMSHLTDSEVRFMKNSHAAGWGEQDILDGVGFMRVSKKKPSHGTLYNALKRSSKKKSRRRKCLKYFNKVRRAKLNRLIKRETRKCNLGIEVTAQYLKDKGNFDCSLSTLKREVQSLKYKWMRPKGFADLSDEDKASRLEFCRKWSSKSINQLKSSFGLVLDEKKFIFRSTNKGKLYDARSSVRGVYSKPNKRHLVSRPNSKHDPGRPRTAQVNVIGGIVGNSVCMWSYYDRMSSKVIADKIQKICEKKSVSKVLMDNHRCHRSTIMNRKLSSMKVRAISFPPRSPDLMPLDFSIWSIVQRRVHAQENRMSKNYVERIQDYKNRLRRSALAISSSTCDRIWESWRNRMRACIESGGGVFSENASFVQVD